jgi:type VI secretion system secreted protein VgrG
MRIRRKAAPVYALPSSEKVVRALETLAPQQYERLSKVSVNPKSNPDDTHWHEEYGDASFSSAATADIEQGVAFFPWKDWREIPQAYVDSTMNHEAAHLWSESLWKDVTKKQGWIEAMARDRKAPSEYASRNEKEDFAESVNMYFSSLGSPCEAKGRENYPARYRYLDEQTR